MKLWKRLGAVAIALITLTASIPVQAAGGAYTELKTVEMTVDLSDYTPLELTYIPVKDVIMQSIEVSEDETVFWKDSYFGGDYDELADDAAVDLADYLYSGAGYESEHLYEFIVGEGNQLATGDTRYLVTVKYQSKDWLKTSVIIKGENGDKTFVGSGKVHDWDARDIYIPAGSVQKNDNVYFKMELNVENYPGKNTDNVKIYKGRYRNADALKENIKSGDAFDITDQLFGNGYLIGGLEGASYFSSSTYITYALEQNGSIMSASYAWIGVHENSSNVYGNVLCLNAEMEEQELYYSYGIETDMGEYEQETYVIENYSNGYDYYYKLMLSSNDASLTADNVIEAVYKGYFISAAEATEAGADNIKAQLISESGLKVELETGYVFTVVYRYSGEEIITRYLSFILKAEKKAVYGDFSWSNHIYDADKNAVDCVCCDTSGYTGDDSYGENNYITYFVDSRVDIKKLKVAYWRSDDENVSVYVNVNATTIPVVSEETLIDFSKGPVQFTVITKDINNTGADARTTNYWIEVKTNTSDGADLYINSLSDENSKTSVKDGIIYTTREVQLDYIHNYRHDLFLVNMGDADADSVRVSLEVDGAFANAISMDNYWTLKGNYPLKAFSTIEKMQENYNQASGYYSDDNENTFVESNGTNMAKLRIKYDKTKVTELDSNEFSGKLIVYSNETPVMVIQLVGMAGDPQIITKNMPNGVLYVPYGTVIQNSNKYSWNSPSYECEGSLPAGLDIDEKTGEIYGVPMETGNYQVTVYMYNDYGADESKRTYSFTIAENTNDNVDAMTDTSDDPTQDYSLLERISDMTSTADYTLRSNGSFGEYKKVFIDGELLTAGTDYTAEEGSTRITIIKQTFDRVGTGTHTIAVEFRQSDNTLKRSAQNYTYTAPANNSGSNASGSRPSGSGSSRSYSGGSSSSSTSASTTGSAATTNDSGKDTTDTASAVEETKEGEPIFFESKTGNGTKIINSQTRKAYRSATVAIDGHRYFTDKKGYLITSSFVKTEKGNTVYVGKTGRIVKNRVFKVDGVKYVAIKNGKIVKDRWIKKDDVWYHCKKDGKVDDERNTKPEE